MKITRKLTAVQQAYERCKLARDALIEMDAQCMEATEDKSGWLWERWIVETTPPATTPRRIVSVVLFSTPHWWDLFTPVTNDQSVTGTLDALRALQQK